MKKYRVGLFWYLKYGLILGSGVVYFIFENIWWCVFILCFFLILFTFYGLRSWIEVGDSKIIVKRFGAKSVEISIFKIRGIFLSFTYSFFSYKISNLTIMFENPAFDSMSIFRQLIDRNFRRWSIGVWGNLVAVPDMSMKKIKELTDDLASRSGKRLFVDDIGWVDPWAPNLSRNMFNIKIVWLMYFGALLLVVGGLWVWISFKLR